MKRHQAKWQTCIALTGINFVIVLASQSLFAAAIKEQPKMATPLPADQTKPATPTDNVLGPAPETKAPDPVVPAVPEAKPSDNKKTQTPPPKVLPKASPAVMQDTANRAKNAPKAPSKIAPDPKSPVTPQDDEDDPSPVPVATMKIEESEAQKGASAVPAGRDLVNMDFPELTDIKDIIKAVALWTGRNVILDRNVTGKIQIISPKRVTKEEAYQAFLSALNMLNLTTVETGRVIKIMKVRNAVKGNLRTFVGSGWAPRTDEIITQIVPLKYIDSKQIQTTLSRIVSSSSMIAYQPTNTLIISDSGYKVRRVLEILELLDVKTQQPKVIIVPIKYSDPQVIAKQVNEILKSPAGGLKGGAQGYNAFKILTDERSNSVIIFGPPRTIKDVRTLVKKFDIKIDDPATQATIHVRPLDYAEAKKLATTLSSLAAGGSKGGSHRPSSAGSSGGRSSDAAIVSDLGDGVKITADETTNSLLITGSRTAYEAFNSIIRKLDTRRSQVFIEADILDLNNEDGYVFGTSIFGGGPSGNNKMIGGWEASKMAPLVVGQATAQSGTGISQTNIQGIADSFKENMTVGILSGKSFKLPGIAQEITPGLLIDMVKTDSNTKIISSPHILTANNAEATMAVGQTILFQSASQANAVTGTVVPKVEKEKVDMTLTLKPNVSYSDYITIDFSLEQNTVANISQGGLPQLATKKTKQIVTVKNGQTIVVSGLVSNTEQEEHKKMPLLGDIPIIGRLFSNTRKTNRRSNLVIFLTPHIVHGAADLAAIYKAKLEERDQFFTGTFGSSSKNDDFYSQLPTVKDGDYRPTEIDKAEEKRMKEERETTLKQIGLLEETPEDKEKRAAEGAGLQEIETSVPSSIAPTEFEGGGGGGGTIYNDDFDKGDSPALDEPIHDDRPAPESPEPRHPDDDSDD